jgi:hypothetical protein
MDAGPGTCPHCYQPLPDPKPIVAHHGLEVRGLLRAIELTEDDFIIATIGALRVVYRADEEVQLRPFLGQRIGTIMIDQTLRVRGLARDGGMQA